MGIWDTPSAPWQAAQVADFSLPAAASPPAKAGSESTPAETNNAETARTLVAASQVFSDLFIVILISMHLGLQTMRLYLQYPDRSGELHWLA